MLRVYNNFVNKTEADELIEYYRSNINREYLTEDEIYNFKGVVIQDYNSLLVSKKLKLYTPKVIRIQLVNSTFKTTDYAHTHRIPWSYVLFLNDSFTGGELIMENITIKPKKYQLIVFPGSVKHRVNQVTEGERYTLVSFTYDEATIKTSNLL